MNNIFQKITKAGEDKVIHFLVCFILAEFFTRLVFALISDKHWICYVFSALVGWVVSYGIGMWKESYDKTHGGSCDQKDLTADALGAWAGAILAVLTILIF